MNFEDVLSWLIGSAENISDVGFVARCFILILGASVVCALISDLMEIGKR